MNAPPMHTGATEQGLINTTAAGQITADASAGVQGQGDFAKLADGIPEGSNDVIFKVSPISHDCIHIRRVQAHELPRLF